MHIWCARQPWAGWACACDAPPVWCTPLIYSCFVLPSLAKKLWKRPDLGSCSIRPFNYCRACSDVSGEPGGTSASTTRRRQPGSAGEGAGGQPLVWQPLPHLFAAAPAAVIAGFAAGQPYGLDGSWPTLILTAAAGWDEPHGYIRGIRAAAAAGRAGRQRLGCWPEPLYSGCWSRGGGSCRHVHAIQIWLSEWAGF